MGQAGPRGGEGDTGATVVGGAEGSTGSRVS